MAEETKLTIEELAARLAEILDRVSAGERFSIVGDGELIAFIAPLPTRPTITWEEFVEAYFTWPRPDGRWVEDMEAVLAEREKDLLPDPKWED
jgi:antitoxin (DNA-binding transcriptional repressor) of toxin-antitoxin stability system